jgi:hypothetical protein
MAACRAMNVIVAADVLNSDSDSLADEDAASAANAENAFEAVADAPKMRLLPHLLALSNVALSLQLNSESNRCIDVRLRI